MSEQLITQRIAWIDTQEKLLECCQVWKSKPLLACDTEFMRSQTYYPITGLIQVNDGDANYLIDPLVIDDLSPLADILRDPAVCKAIHACSEDLEVFQRLLNCVPENLFDTQIAAAMTGYGFSVGYANLVAAAMKADLPKNETRSDWLARPLSRAQTIYAAIDVEYLYQLALMLQQQLQTHNRSHWLREECDSFLKQFAENQNPEFSFLRFKSAWKLSPRKLACLKKLATWREETARLRDVPRNRVIKEHTLFAIAEKMPSHMAQLRKFEGLTERMLRADGEAIVNHVADAKAINDAMLPGKLEGPLPPPLAEYHKKIRAFVKKIAEQHDIPAELLVKKKDYEHIVRRLANITTPQPGDDAFADILPPSFSGWRNEVVGKPLVTALQQGEL